MSLFEEEEIPVGDAACFARKPACPKNDGMIWKLSIKAEFLDGRREKSTLSPGDEGSGFALPESWSLLEQMNAGR